ncbi:hypothetical protein [Nitrosomonas marina]|uniref:Uncharacterized protein n=1 Tax=Nitrosomonas marina TaxID=917 RepID=A0A1H8IY76_9PROT|nr:hypothetical protein [Nitrosomonas marina]SEN73125.1 hypothetical protein SAMN05216325_1443 [Nitrosomonas marina]
MDKYERRRLNLIKLRDEKCNGVNAEIARKIGKDQSYVNRIFYPEGKKGKKRIGDDIKEIIETEFGLPTGWLDGVDSNNILGIDETKLTFKNIEMMRRIARMDEEYLNVVDDILKIVENKIHPRKELKNK